MNKSMTGAFILLGASLGLSVVGRIVLATGDYGLAGALAWLAIACIGKSLYEWPWNNPQA